MAEAPPSKPTSKVSKQSITRAVKALLKWHSTNPKPEKPDEFLYLVVTLNQIPPNFRPQQNPIRIPLPHSLSSPYSPHFTICLLVEDRFSLSSREKIEREDLPISNVIKMSKLKSDYKSFEDKKKLCDSYDVFLADKSVVVNLPKVLGRYFYKRKKGPVGIELSRGDWREQIEEVCGSTTIDLQKRASCNVVRVARVGMEKGEIVENVGAAVDGVVEVVPKKWRNVRALHLKCSESLAMPIYEAGGGELGIVGEKRKRGDGEEA